MSDGELAIVCNDLQGFSPALSGYLQKAGNYVETDPRSSVFNMRLFVELTANHILAFRGEHIDRRMELSAKIDRIRAALPEPLVRLMVELVRYGNKAAHEHEEEIARPLAERLLQKAIRVGKWFLAYMRENRGRISRPMRKKPTPNGSEGGSPISGGGSVSGMGSGTVQVPTSKGEHASSHEYTQAIVREEQIEVANELSKLIERIEGSADLRDQLPPKTVRRLKRTLTAVAAKHMTGAAFVGIGVISGGLSGVVSRVSVIFEALNFLQSITVSSRSEPQPVDGYLTAETIEMEKLQTLAAAIAPFEETAIALQSAYAHFAWASLEEDEGEQ